MTINVSTIDVNKTRENWPPNATFSPALVVSKPDGKWLVLDAPHTPGVQPTWADADSDGLMRIPVFQYHLNPNADLALAFMLQLGLSFVGYLQEKIKQVHIVTGDPVELIYDEQNNLKHMVCWIGFAVSPEY